MGVPLNRITNLDVAYQWENSRIRDWITNMGTNPGSAANNVAGRFQTSWEEYFAEILGSNDAARAICAPAIAAADDNLARKAIKKINRRFHRKVTIAALANIANDKGSESEYFDALGSAIDLEEEARDYIEKFLKTGTIS